MIDGAILAFSILALAAAAVIGTRLFRTLVRERAASAAREAELHVILDATVDAIIVIDERSVIRAFNSAAQRIFGYSEAEALGQNVSLLIAEPDRLQHTHHVENYLQTGSPKVLDRRREVTAQRKNGERFPAELSVQEASIAGQRVFVGVLQDMTEKKRVDAELQSSREQYIRELEKKQIVFRTLSERLGAATGEQFFESLVRHLARTFNTRYAMVAKTAGDGDGQATTISICDGDTLMENFEYELCGTPCELVLDKGELCAFPKDLPRLFPDDPLITQMEAESYLGAPLLGPDGEVCGLIAILDTKELTDIETAGSVLNVFATRAASELDRLTAAAALTASEERYRAVFDAASDGIVVISSTIRIKTVNPAVCRMYGGSCAEFLGRRPSKFIHPDHLKEFNNFLRRLRASGSASVETVAVRKNGEPVEVEVRGSAVTIAGEMHILAIVRDISDRKQAERAERETAERLARLSEEQAFLLDNMGDFVYRYDANGHFSYMSPAAERITGRTLDDFRMRYNAYITDHPANQRIIENTERSMRSGESFPPHELEIYHKNGSRITLEIVERPHVENGQVTGIVGVARDVTERKRMQSELRLAKFSVDHAADAALWIAPDGSVEYANETVCEYLGYTRKEALRLKIHDVDVLTPEIVWPDRWQEIAEASRVVGESIYRTKDGREFPVDVIVNHLEFEGREYAIMVARDITERKQAESALKESERRTRAIIDSAIDAVVVMDQRGAILEWNPQAEMTFGWTADEAIGRQLSDLIIPEAMIEKHTAGLERYLSHGDAPALNRRTELTARNRKGEEFPVEVAVTTHKHHSEFVFSAFIRDLTLRKKLEHETTRAQKLESVGLLAGGIAHDFNNLLSGVLGNVSMALRGEELSKDTALYLSEAERALVKAAGLTQQLLTFSKGGNPVKKSVSIAELLVDSISFALRGSSVKPVFSIADDLRLAEVDSGQISQALHNLAINAKQASPNGGRLIVEAANVDFNGGPGIELVISDHGIGISERHLSKIFDPYFTTKPTGNGLGLATTYSIIKKHGGVIEVDSQVGIGTTFRLRLPASDARAACATPKSRQELRGEGRILVMDDEDFLRTLAERMISGFGYTVDTAAEGAEAIVMYQRAAAEGNPYCVIILDLTIPGGMGGKETLDRLREINPAVKAIVCSGYAVDPVVSEFGEHGFIGCVAKPYRPHEMAEAIQAALNTPTSIPTDS